MTSSVTDPNKSSSGVINYTRYGLTEDQRLPAGVEATVVWNQVVQSRGVVPVTDNGDGTFTVNVAGVYRLVAGMDWPLASREGLRYMVIEVNGVKVASRAVGVDSGDGFGTMNTGPITLAVNDVIRVRAQQNQGTTQPLQANPPTFFSILKLGSADYKRFGLSAARAIANGSNVLVDWDNTDESGGTINLTLNADGSITVNESGAYRVVASMEWPTASQTGRRTMFISPPDGAQAGGDVGNSSGAGWAISDTGPIEITAGGVIYVRAFQNVSASSVNLQDSRLTWVSVEKLSDTLPYKRWTIDAAQTIPTNVNTFVTWDTVVYDQGSLPVTLAGDTFTFDEGSVYEVIAGCIWANNSAGYDGINISHRSGLVGATRSGEGATSGRGQAVGGPYAYLASETVRTYVRQTSGGDRDLDAAPMTFVTVVQLAG